MKVLLSIKPEFAYKIFCGEKKYEYRRRIFNELFVSSVVIYATRPVGLIIGEFQIDNILQGPPFQIWHLTRDYPGICRQYFYEYFSGTTNAYAIKVGTTIRYKSPVDPYRLINNFKPPQSFMYYPSKLPAYTPS